MAPEITTSEIQVLLPEGVELTTQPKDNGDGTFSLGVTPRKDLYNESLTVIYKGDAQTIPLSTKQINIKQVDTAGKLVPAGEKKKFTLTFDADIRVENVEWKSEDGWKLAKPIAHPSGGNNKKCEILLEAPRNFSQMIESTITFGYKGGSTLDKVIQVEQVNNVFLNVNFKPESAHNEDTVECILTYAKMVKDEDLPILEPSEGLKFISREVNGKQVIVTYEVTAASEQSVTVTTHKGKANETSRRATLTVN